MEKGTFFFFLQFYIFILKNRIAISKKKKIQHFEKVIALFQGLKKIIKFKKFEFKILF